MRSVKLFQGKITRRLSVEDDIEWSHLYAEVGGVCKIAPGTFTISTKMADDSVLDITSQAALVKAFRLGSPGSQSPTAVRLLIDEFRRLPENLQAEVARALRQQVERKERQLSCPSCTFLNSSLLPRCEMCDTDLRGVHSVSISDVVAGGGFEEKEEKEPVSDDNVEKKIAQVEEAPKMKAQEEAAQKREDAVAAKEERRVVSQLKDVEEAKKKADESAARALVEEAIAKQKIEEEELAAKAGKGRNAKKDGGRSQEKSRRGRSQEKNRRRSQEKSRRGRKRSKAGTGRASSSQKEGRRSRKEEV